MVTNNAWNSENPAQVSKGGTGLASTTAYAVLCGGTTSTAPLQSVVSVGSSGQVLTSNGASTLPTFQTFTSVGGPSLGYTSGNYYRAGFWGLSSGTIAMAANTMYLTPFYVGSSITVDRLAFEVSAFGAGGNIRMGIYNCSGGLPTTLLLDAGQLTLSSNTVYESTISQALTAGTFYYIAILCSYNPTVYTMAASQYGVGTYPLQCGTSGTTAPGNMFSVTRTYASGLNANLTGSTFTNISVRPNIQYRVA